MLLINIVIQPGQSDSRNGEKPRSGETTPPKSTSTPSKSLSQDSIADTETPKRALEHQTSLPPASPSSVGGRSDAESDAEQGSTGTPARLEGATKDEVVAMFKKQERVLARYKTRFSEVHVVIVLWRFVVCLFVCLFCARSDLFSTACTLYVLVHRSTYMCLYVGS